MNPIGTIKPPITSIPENPINAVGSLFSMIIQIFIVVAGITVFIVLLLGALDWITSGGDKERLVKAQQKITNAVVGIIVLIVVLSVSCFINITILHIADDIGTCFNFIIPTL